MVTKPEEKLCRSPHNILLVIKEKVHTSHWYYSTVNICDVSQTIHLCFLMGCTSISIGGRLYESVFFLIQVPVRFCVKHGVNRGGVNKLITTVPCMHNLFTADYFYRPCFYPPCFHQGGGSYQWAWSMRKRFIFRWIRSCLLWTFIGTFMFQFVFNLNFRFYSNLILNLYWIEF